MKETYSVHAAEDARARIEVIAELLAGITIQMQKYDGQTWFHYGHVRDLSQIEALLSECYEVAVESN